MERSKSVVALVAMCGVLAACSGEAEDRGRAEVTTALAQQAAATETKSQVVSGIQRRNSTGRTYQNYLSTGGQYNFGSQEHHAYIDLYWSKADPVNKELLAETLFDDFAKEKDAFKRQDKLKELEPQLNVYLEKVKRITDIAINTSASVWVHPYDMQTQSYKIQQFVNFQPWGVQDHERGQNQYFITVLNQKLTEKDSLFELQVDETEARRIEAILAPLRSNQNQDSVSLRVKVKGHVVHVGEQRNVSSGTMYSFIAPDAIDLVNPKTGETILSIPSDKLPKVMSATANDISNIANGDVRENFIKKFNIPEPKLVFGGSL